MNNILETKNLSKIFKDFELKGINLSLPKGCIMGLIGENGAGKSTTMKLILNMIVPSSGSVSIMGKDNRKSPDFFQENVGVVLDECGFPENLSLNNINTVMKNIYKTWSEETFNRYATQFNLPPKKILKEYSRGMTMKLSIAVALSHGAKLLILDEATSGLDPIVRDEILDAFLDFIQDESHSILISSHITSDLEKICDYIAFIHNGELIFSEEKDFLIDEYGILKCSEREFATIDKSATKGYRKNAYGVEALVLRSKVPASMIVDKASIEDIMLYHVKENVQ